MILFGLSKKGNKMKDLTLVVCSYNTPQILELMLKSYVSNHKEDKYNIIIMENSTNEETVELLTKYNIPFHRRPGSTHSIAVDEALKMVKTKYALLVDSDIVFNKDISPIYNWFKKNDYVALGEVCGDRGGYSLFPRIFPWFCMLDMETINGKGISFHDQVRIDKTNSGKFFGNVPLMFDRSGKYYDVGSTFLEDILKNGLKVGNSKFDTEYFTHYEGMSWHKVTNHPWFLDVYKSKESGIKEAVEKYNNVEVGCFV